MLFSFELIGVRIRLLLVCCGDVQPNPGPESNLKIVYFNVCSLRNKTDLVKAKFNTFDVICISETWLHKDDVDNIVIPGYHTPVRKDRMTRGGGVAIYVKECLFHKHVLDLDVNGLEAVWVNIRIKNHNTLIGCFYRSDYSTAYWDLMYDLISAANDMMMKAIIVGDFNEDVLGHNHSHIDNICQF